MSLLVLAGIVVTFATSVIGLVTSLRNGRKVDQVHVLVNSQLHAVLDRVEQLTGTLVSAGVDVPQSPDQGSGGPRARGRRGGRGPEPGAGQGGA